jgi:O-methyltransferase involved in polyketide biosynthesis
VVCLYNSVNHARSVEHLRATLANVAAHLAPHGLLLFDYVSHDSFEQSWECDEEIEMEDGVRTIHYVYERSGRRASCVIDRGRRIDQTMFAAGEIEESLASTGFTVVRETSLAGPTLLPSRQLVLARRTINL